MPAMSLLPEIAAAAGGRPCYLVGGCLRDILLGRNSKDLDFAVPEAAVLAADVARHLGRPLVGLNDRWPLYRVPVGGVTLDFTALRADTLENDLLLRDFTINALGAPLADFLERGEEAIVDPAGGRADLAERRIRLVHKEGLRDDPLRMLRAFRLAGELGFEIEPDLLERIHSAGSRIRSVAPERVRDELFRILATRGAADLLRAMGERGLVQQVIPILAATFAQEQTHYHHLNVWQHLLETIRQLDGVLADESWLRPIRGQLLDLLTSAPPHGRTRLQLLRLAALLHDVGKPATAVTDSRGLVHFYDHARVGAQAAERIAQRLRLSRREQKELTTLVELHLLPLQLLQTHNWQGRPGNRLLNRTGELAPLLLLLSLADHLASRGPATTEAELREHREMTANLLERHFTLGTAAPPPVNGDALMGRYGLRPGRRVGRLLAEIGDIHLQQPFAGPAEVWAYLESRHPDLQPGGDEGRA